VRWTRGSRRAGPPPVHAAQNGAAARLPAAHLQPVAEEVEPELAGGAVGDVRLVRRHPVALVHLLLQDADGHPELLVHRADPLGVALRQVVVHGGDVDALARQGVEVRRRRRADGLALAGRQLDQPAEVHDRAGRELHVERADAERPLDRDGDQPERLRQERVEVPLARALPRSAMLSSSSLASDTSAYSFSKCRTRGTRSAAFDSRRFHGVPTRATAVLTGHVPSRPGVFSIFRGGSA
jgi:hypothetical protein